MALPASTPEEVGVTFVGQRMSVLADVCRIPSPGTSAADLRCVILAARSRETPQVPCWDGLTGCPFGVVGSVDDPPSVPQSQVSECSLRQDGPHSRALARETADVSEVSPITELLDLAHGLRVIEPATAGVAWSEDGIQIRSRDRVRDLAEVYTHDREVNAVLDLVPSMFPSEDDPGNTDCSFLEPACGHGNFLVEILRRKLSFVTTSRYGSGENFEYRMLRCFSFVPATIPERQTKQYNINYSWCHYAADLQCPPEEHLIKKCSKAVSASMT